MSSMGDFLQDMMDEAVARTGQEKTEEIIDFGHRTEKMLHTRRGVKALWMLALMVCNDADDLIELLYNANAMGALMYRSALEQVAPELVEQVDAKFFEGGDHNGEEAGS